MTGISGLGFCFGNQACQGYASRPQSEAQSVEGKGSKPSLRWAARLEPQIAAVRTRVRYAYTCSPVISIIAASFTAEGKAAKTAHHTHVEAKIVYHPVLKTS